MPITMLLVEVKAVVAQAFSLQAPEIDLRRAEVTRDTSRRELVQSSRWHAKSAQAC